MRVRLPIPARGTTAADLPDGGGTVEEHLVDHDGVGEIVEEGVGGGDGGGVVGDQCGFVGQGGTDRGAGGADDHSVAGDDQSGVQVGGRQHAYSGVEEAGEGGGGGGVRAYRGSCGDDGELVPGTQG